MDIVDFNKIFNIAESENNNRHFLAPKWPFRLLILGPSGCGKTNLLFNLIIRQLSFDKLWIYSRHLDQPLYKKLSELLGLDESLENDQILMSSNLDNVVYPDDLNKDETNLLVFDDFVTTKNQSCITDAFIRGRHANCSCIYITQCYFPVPKDIRLNCNYFVIFNVQSKRELVELQKDHATNIDKEDFQKLYREAVFDPYSFFVIDKCTNFLPLAYRKRFNGLNTFFPR